jgi:hypothetical protein
MLKVSRTRAHGLVRKGDFYYVLFLGNAWLLVDFLDLPLDLVLFLHDAGESVYVPANAVASSALAKEICRRGDRNR